MPNAFARRLRLFASFTDREVAALVRISADAEPRRRGQDLVRHGDRPDAVHFLLSGWACRYKVLDDGKRQILAYLLPGDVCDLHVSLLSRMDHHIGLLSDALIAAVPADEVHAMMDMHREIERALWCSTLADAAILREWLVTAGRRDAFSAVGHRLCEIRHRLKAVGLVDKDGAFDLPLSQEELADSLGLSSVHVNRVLSRLRARELILADRRRMTLTQPERLAEMTGFDASYLHPCSWPRDDMRKSGLG